MIDETNVYEHISIDPDLSVYDIDIDFELNTGKPFWVVILRRNDRCYPESKSYCQKELDPG